MNLMTHWIYLVISLKGPWSPFKEPVILAEYSFKPLLSPKNKNGNLDNSYHSSFLPFVHSISSNIRSGHSIAAPYQTHWHQSTKSLPDLIGISCGHTCTNADETLDSTCKSLVKLTCHRGIIYLWFNEDWECGEVKFCHLSPSEVLWEACCLCWKVTMSQPMKQTPEKKLLGSIIGNKIRIY